MTTISIVDIFDVLNTVSISTPIIKEYFKTSLKGHIMTNTIKELEIKIAKKTMIHKNKIKTMGVMYTGYACPKEAYMREAREIEDLKKELSKLKEKSKPKEDSKPKVRNKGFMEISRELEDKTMIHKNKIKTMGVMYTGYAYPKEEYMLEAREIEDLKKNLKMLKEK